MYKTCNILDSFQNCLMWHVYRASLCELLHSTITSNTKKWAQKKEPDETCTPIIFRVLLNVPVYVLLAKFFVLLLPLLSFLDSFKIGK